jgi:hypothetical protein
MKRIFLLAGLAAALAACEAIPPWTPLSTAPVVAPAGSAPVSRDPFFGRWTGATERGGSVEIVLAEGSSRYTFRGQPVPVTGARIEGDAMVLTVGEGGGTVTLRPMPGGRLAYNHRFRSDRASAVLVRA